MRGTREEQLLENIANGETPEITPITREEKYLAKIAGADIEVPKPVLRTDKLYKKIIDNGSASYQQGYSDGYTAGVASVQLYEIEANTNDTYDPEEPYSGFSRVRVEVPAPALGQGHMDITENGEYTIYPDIGYEGMSEATVNVNVPTGGGGAVLQLVGAGNTLSALKQSINNIVRLYAGTISFGKFDATLTLGQQSMSASMGGSVYRENYRYVIASFVIADSTGTEAVLQLTYDQTDQTWLSDRMYYITNGTLTDLSANADYVLSNLALYLYVAQ